MVTKKWTMLLTLGIVALALAIAVPMFSSGATVEGKAPEVKVKVDAKNAVGDKGKVDVSCKDPVLGGCDGTASSLNQPGKAEFKPFGGLKSTVVITCAAVPSPGDIDFFSGTITGFPCVGGLHEATVMIDANGSQFLSFHPGTALGGPGGFSFGLGDKVKAKVEQKP